MKNLKKYVEQLNGWNKIFGGELITFPLSAGVKEELLDRLEADMSPENLCCDGELPAAQVAKKAAYLNAVLADLKGIKLSNKPDPKAAKPVVKGAGFVVYEVVSTNSPFKKYGSVQVFATLAVAKAMKSRFLKANPDYPELDVVAVEDFAGLEKTKKVKNLMSGKEVEIPVNTPLACDPSSETYWSM